MTAESNGPTPIPMRLTCPECGVLHVDAGEFATKVHHTHSCQECGMTWRPAVAPTVGVRFLPGFKDAEPPSIGVQDIADLRRILGAQRWSETERCPRDVTSNGYCDLHQGEVAPTTALFTGHAPNDPAWLLGEIEWWKREHERLQTALIEIRALCSDRQRFVMMGPRGFSAALQICERALISPDPHIFHRSLVSDSKRNP